MSLSTHEWDMSHVNVLWHANKWAMSHMNVAFHKHESVMSYVNQIRLVWWAITVVGLFDMRFIVGLFEGSAFHICAKKKKRKMNAGAPTDAWIQWGTDKLILVPCHYFVCVCVYTGYMWILVLCHYIFWCVCVRGVCACVWMTVAENKNE